MSNRPLRQVISNTDEIFNLFFPVLASVIVAFIMPLILINGLHDQWFSLLHIKIGRMLTEVEVSFIHLVLAFLMVTLWKLAFMLFSYRYDNTLSAPISLRVILVRIGAPTVSFMSMVLVAMISLSICNVVEQGTIPGHHRFALSCVKFLFLISVVLIVITNEVVSWLIWKILTNSHWSSLKKKQMERQKIVNAAIAKFRDIQGHFPETLEALLPYLPGDSHAIPSDPVTGKRVWLEIRSDPASTIADGIKSVEPCIIYSRREMSFTILELSLIALLYVFLSVLCFSPRLC